MQRRSKEELVEDESDENICFTTIEPTSSKLSFKSK
jgi:hypothetical protein